MSGPRFFVPNVAVLTAALFWVSAAAAHAAPAHTGASHGGSGGSGGYHGGSSGYHGGYTGGYHSGYYGGGYRSGYYGRYNGGYAPGYFSSLGGYYPGAGLGGYYNPTYVAPTYVYPSTSLSVLSGGSPDDLGPVTPSEGPPTPPDGAAAVGVVVPADAEVWFNGDPTKQKGEQREFVTPTLPVGRAYQYEIRARWKENGKVVDQTRTVIVHSNQRTDVDFARAEPIGAPIPAPPE